MSAEKPEEAPSQRGAGRPREFDADAVVDAAVPVFWSRGFDGTSLGKLEEATGADRSTIYNSFAGKRGLHALAAEQYVDRVIAELLAPLDDAERTGAQRILDFLGALRAVTAAPEFPCGCFIINDLGSENRSISATDRYFDALHDSIAAAVSQSTDDDKTATARTNQVLAAVVGINATAQHDVDRALDLLDSIVALVGTW